MAKSSICACACARIYMEQQGDGGNGFIITPSGSVKITELRHAVNSFRHEYWVQHKIGHCTHRILNSIGIKAMVLATISTSISDRSWKADNKKRLKGCSFS